MCVTGWIPFAGRKVRKLCNHYVARRFAQMATGSKPDIDETLVSQHLQSLVDGVPLYRLQGSPPFGRACGPKYSEALWSRKRDIPPSAMIFAGPSHQAP